MRSGDLIQLIDDVSFFETVLQLVEQLQLLFWFEVINHVQELLRWRWTDETRNVHINERRHQELTIETVHNTAMSWNHVSKVLDFKCPLKSRRKESSEWSNDGTEDTQRQWMQHEWVDSNRLHRSKQWKAVLLRLEQIAWFALDRHSTGALGVLDRTNKVLKPAEIVGK